MNSNSSAFFESKSTGSTTLSKHSTSLFNRLNTQTKILLGFSVPMVLLVVISLVVYLSLDNVISTSKWVKHTHQVIADGKELEKLMLDMETGERGFLITGKENFLEPYNQAQQVWDTKIKALELLVNDNQAQVARLESVDELKEQWLLEAAQVEINKRRQMNSTHISLDYMQKVLREGLGKSILDQFRSTLEQATSHFKDSNTL